MTKMSSNENLELIIGADEIAKFLGEEPARVRYLLTAGVIPGRKLGQRWVSSRPLLRRHFADLIPDRPEAA